MRLFFLYNVSMQYVIFDFNGTILDDVKVSIDCLNKTIKKYLLRDFISIEEYKRIFTFPIKKYYEAVGFDFDQLDWYEVGQFWMDEYLNNYTKCKLNDGIIDLLIKNKAMGIKNVVLSASRIDILTKQLTDLNIIDYFDEVLGIDNIYATSKLPIGLNFIADKDRSECVMIGDTLHDLEVARMMGVRCILVSCGHQDKNILLENHNEVYDDIRSIKI